MPGAAGVKRCVTMWAAEVSLQIFLNGEGIPAIPAENSRDPPVLSRPWHRRVICQGAVALGTGIEFAAALEPDGDDVQFGAIVRALGAVGDFETANIHGGNIRRLVASLQSKIESRKSKMEWDQGPMGERGRLRAYCAAEWECLTMCEQQKIVGGWLQFLF